MLTPGYSNFFSENTPQDITRFYHPGWVAHGVVITTAAELGKIINALFTGRLISPLLLEQMLYPIHLLGKSPFLGLLGYGLGLFLSVDSPYEKVGGNVGEGPGYSVATFHFSNLSGNRVTLVALANRDQHDLGLRLVFQMVRTLESFLL